MSWVSNLYERGERTLIRTWRMSRKVKIEYYTIEGYSLDFHKLIINFMPLFLCWITIPGSFLILRNMTPNSWQLTGATRSEVRLNGSELSWLTVTEETREAPRVRVKVTSGHWLETGDWHQPRSGWRLYRQRGPAATGPHWACATQIDSWTFTVWL